MLMRYVIKVHAFMLLLGGSYCLFKPFCHAGVSGCFVILFLFCSFVLGMFVLFCFLASPSTNHRTIPGIGKKKILSLGTKVTKILKSL